MNTKLTNNEIKNNCFKYFIYSLLAWDLKDRKVETDPRNDVYFFSDEYRKKFCKILEDTRKKNIIKIRYLGNDKTSTNYNVYEKNDGEVIIAFRGSDSKMDWAADFAFFKTNFKNENTEALLSMSKEDFDQLCMKEYIKSCESLFDDPIKYFSKATMKPIKDVNITIGNIYTKIADVFEKYKSKISLHGGFISQYSTVSKELDEIVTEYCNDKRFNKITFCGHSLGSSLAQLTYVFQFLKHPNEENKFSCYIAGTPKVGNLFYENFIKESNLFDKLYIMNISNDMVSMVPPNKFGFVKNINTVEIEPIGAPFNTKMNHTLFYYLYCIKNCAPTKVNSK